MHQTEQFDDRLLEAFIQHFYGYGNYFGKYWLIGMEEGGGGSYADITRRLNAWQQRNNNELDDLFESARDSVYFGQRAKLQRTWAMLIRLVLSAERHNLDRESVRNYQTQFLGRKDQQTCLPELLPLPSPSTKDEDWIYGTYSSLLYLARRDTYMTYVVQSRADHLKARICEYRPPVVVFYSMNEWYRAWWRYIADVEFTTQLIGAHKVLVGMNTHTIFIISKHPVTKGISNAYFHEVGSIIASHFDGK